MLEECGLKVNWEKCKFLRSFVEYLGHVISAEGLNQSPKKVKVITEMPKPQDATQLGTFLGKAQYYAKRGQSEIVRVIVRYVRRQQIIQFVHLHWWEYLPSTGKAFMLLLLGKSKKRCLWLWLMPTASGLRFSWWRTLLLRRPLASCTPCLPAWDYLIRSYPTTDRSSHWKFCSVLLQKVSTMPLVHLTPPRPMVEMVFFPPEYLFSTFYFMEDHPENHVFMWWALPPLNIFIIYFFIGSCYILNNHINHLHRQRSRSALRSFSWAEMSRQGWT